MKSKNPSSFVFALSMHEIDKVKFHIENNGWELSELQNALWKASKGKTNICAYKSGKLCVQGKESYDFVTFVLEPEILGRLLLDYLSKPEPEQEEEYVAHAGIDESGKGDFFGPLVIAAVFVDTPSKEKLLKAGVRDSKKINDGNILKLAGIIRSTVGGAFSVVAIGPEAYNRLYDKIGNLNRLLAWGHARALENIVEKVPSCGTAVADKFGNEQLIIKALIDKGKKIRLIQRTKAESDIAVAAASVLARESFLKGLARLGEKIGCRLPKGASKQVEDAASEILRKSGIGVLESVSKMHFKTFSKVTSSFTP